jgi:predicted Zn finger-like uncharacterized protein
MLTLAVTANDLRMGQGYVRCGRCANVFNALLTLSEEPAAEESSPAPTPADRPSQSQITKAMRQEPDPSGANAPPGTGINEELRSQVHPVEGPVTQLPTEQSSDGSIENESSRAEGTGTFETIVLEGEAITQIEEYVPEESVDSEIAALTQRLEIRSQEPIAAPAAGTSDAADAADATDLSEADTELGADEADEAQAHEAADLGALLAGARTAESGAGSEAISDPEQALVAEPSSPSDQTARRWPWITGITALSLLLMLQMIHHWRDALAASPAFATPLTHAYAALGMPLDPHWDLAAYDVRQQGATADAGDSQLIHVRLSLANHALRAQPAPVIRLTLLDRYGKQITASDVPPEQYWPGGSPPRALLAHDERVDSEVAVRDPSAASASFELDVCLRTLQGVLRCASELPAK